LIPEPVATVYRIASVDARGRVSDLSVVRVLGWSRRQRVAISVSDGAVLFQAQTDGLFCLTGQGYVRIPAPVREWCGLAAGDRVLVAADSQRGVLIVHTLAALDELLASRHDALLGGEVS
jgi:hypothetical protein